MKRLIVAEKPSVGRDVAKALGLKASGGTGLIEGPDLVVTWCIGHLVELAEPHEYRPEWKSWRAASLPMLPDSFKTRPRGGSTVDQWRVVSTALRRRDISEVVNACDAGREGELIFRMVYDLAGCSHPVRRLWISSLTPEAIRDGFRRLRPGAEFDDLAAAAACRNQADWLVGINATRASTVMAGRAFPDGRLLSVGRVQTPTLALIAERDAEIESFVPEDYFELWADFRTRTTAATSILYRGRWLGPEGETRFSEIERARAVEAAVAGRPGIVESCERKTVEEKPPLLFDLTSLQRTANRAFGLSAARTLAVAQQLYEKHKLITYPRTDSRFLTPDLESTLRSRVEALQTEPYRVWADELLGRPNLPSLARMVQPAKVKDHHAILPTAKSPRLDSLSPEERKIYDLIARRFLGAFYPPARFLDVVAITRVDTPERPEAAERFRSHGRSLLEAGWREVAGLKDPEKPEPRRGAKPKKDAETADEPEPGPGAELLSKLAVGQLVDVETTGIDEKQTRPPPRYTDGSLLTAMEGAGKLIEEEALREAMKDSGLGTPATRASILETLLDRGYIVRNGKTFEATEAGRTLLRFLEVAELKSPELTGRWEARLARMARGEESAARFMEDIRRFVVEAIHKILSTPRPETVRTTVGKCPRCGAEVVAGRSYYECSAAREGACRTRIPVRLAGKALPEKVVTDLLERGRTGIVRGFRSKAGKTFSAALELDEEGEIKFNFDAAPARSPRRRAEGSPTTAPGGRKRRVRTQKPYGGPARSTSAPAPRSAAAEPATRPKPRKTRATPLAPPPGPTIKGPREPARQVTPNPATTVAPGLEELGAICPLCEQGQLVTGRRGWGCSRWRDGCSFVVWFEQAGKQLTQAQARELVTRGRTRILTGFRDPQGQPYRAKIVLNRDRQSGKLETRIQRE